MIDELLNRYNLKYEDLTPSERETLNVWVDAMQKGQLSVEKIRDYISSMKDAVEHELVKQPLFVRRFVFKYPNLKLIRLQARLNNYMLLSGLLSTPERAKKEIEAALGGMSGTKA